MQGRRLERAALAGLLTRGLLPACDDRSGSTPAPKSAIRLLIRRISINQPTVVLASLGRRPDGLPVWPRLPTVGTDLSGRREETPDAITSAPCPRLRPRPGSSSCRRRGGFRAAT